MLETFQKTKIIAGETDACVQVHEAVAAIRVQLARSDHHLAVPDYRQRHKTGRVQLAVQGSLLPAEQAQVGKNYLKFVGV